MILFELNNLDEQTNEAIRKNNDRHYRWEIDSITHEENYEAIQQHWRLETERILSLKKNPYES